MINAENLCMGCMSDNGGAGICPICGYDSSLQNHSQALPTRFVLQSRYIVGKALSVNGEGITYIGWDNATDSVVRIKEYFPLGVAIRNPDTSVSIAEGKKYTFNEGLLGFIDINRNIMSQKSTSIMGCTAVFEASGTAYAVLEYVQGITLRDFLDRNGGTLKWEQARALLLPLIDAIKTMNDNGVMHKGISPETIIVGRDGKLRIKDYSIDKLRMAGTDIECEIFDGYAAIEQYGIYEMQTGTFTDVYGFCATLFNVLIGSEIPKATLRIEDQSLSIPAKFVEELPRHVLAALANGLKVKPQERTYDIEALKNELVYGEIVEQESKVSPKTDKKTVEKEKKSKSSKSNIKYILISALATVLFFAIVGTALVLTVFKDDVFGNESSSGETSSLTSAPVVDEIGSVDSDAVESVKLYAVPDFVGKTYAEIIADEENEVFKISVKYKVFSDEIPKGRVCKQSIDKGEEVKRDSKIELTISLGPDEFKMPNVIGLDEQSAKLELLKSGFLYDNIEVLEKYDEQSEPGVILEQTPQYKEKVNADIVIKIYKNTYEGEEPMGGGDDDEILSDIVATTP